MKRLISHERVEAQRHDRTLESRLRRGVQGEVHFDAFTRGLYSTDASIYQVEPAAVAFPRDEADVRRTLEIAAESGRSVVPRGAGTSQSGQSIGPGVIADTSRHLNQILDFEPEARRVVVQPGIVLDQLNAFLRPYGLFYPIDVATASRATLGGMTGNNSAGARSIRYGHMVEHVRGIRGVTADGRSGWFGPAEAPGAGGTQRPELEGALRDLYTREADELARRIPDLPRHVAGYALQRLSNPGAPISDVLVGSEGTLAFFTALSLDLQPIPGHRVLGVCRFDGISDALAAVPSIVELEPTAVELVDHTLLGLAADIPSFTPTLEQIGPAGGPPPDILIVEFAGEDPDRVRAQLDALEETLTGRAPVVRGEDAAFQGRIWSLRKAGLNISMSMPADRKPLAFIEDCVIPLDRLPEWYAKLTEIIEAHETQAVWYAHASVGVLHVRPALDLRTTADQGRLRTIAEAAFSLAHEMGGSFSGEHGDGWIRSEFLEPMLGRRLVDAFGEIKQAFDPDRVLNPGKIVDPPRMNDGSLLRARYRYDRGVPETALDWSHWGGFDRAVDMCNNNGTCRKSDPGVMCPSFRATADERHSTRGRANTLRLAMSGELGSDPWTSPDLYEAMDLCLGCKACKRECPTGVDMSRMKIEFLHRRRAQIPATARDRAIAYLPRVAPLASKTPWLANLRNRSGMLARASERWLGLAADRPLPAWAKRPFRGLGKASAAAPEGDALLFVDTFTRYFEPENAYAAARVLEAAGYRVQSAEASGRPLCCGRTFLNAGLLAEARTELERTRAALLRAVEAGTPIVGLEPSCLLTLRDELPALLPGPESEAVAAHASLFTELLVDGGALDRLDLVPLPTARAEVHGHCHEKAFGAEGATLDVLRAIPDLEVEPIAAGCCGMAGSFGYEAEHADVSRRVGELDLLPHVRGLEAGTWLVANGTSCRHQVADLAGVEGRHVARVLDAALAPEATP